MYILLDYHMIHKLDYAIDSINWMISVKILFLWHVILDAWKSQAIILVQLPMDNFMAIIKVQVIFIEHMC